MIVVCNSSVIISLSAIDKIYILWRIFDEIYVPTAVYHEVCIKGKSCVGSHELENAVRSGRIKVMKPKNTLLVESLIGPLGRGEAEAIVLGIELSADYVCIDEKLARRKAEQLGVKVKGTLGILWEALKRGLISSEEFRKSIDALEDFGFRIEKNIVMNYLRKLKTKD